MDDLGSPRGTGRVQGGARQSAPPSPSPSVRPATTRRWTLPAMVRSMLFRAMPGAVFRRRPPRWLTTVSGRQPAHATLNVAADEGLRPLDPRKVPPQRCGVNCGPCRLALEGTPIA